MNPFVLLWRCCAVPCLRSPMKAIITRLTEQQLGTVHFPVSCTPKVQKPFERGVALLHSFWYEEAEKEFEQIAKDDPKCAMAQWGLAMSQWHQLWNHPDAATTKKGRAEIKKARSLHAATARERDYIDAMKAFHGTKGKYDRRATAYTKAMEKVISETPMITKLQRSMRSRCLPPPTTMIRISRMTKKRQRFWKSYLPPSPTIRAWHIT